MENKVNLSALQEVLKKINPMNVFRPIARISKHQASKKGYKHNHKLSKGESNHLKFIR